MMKKMTCIRLIAAALLLAIAGSAQAAPDLRDILKGAGGAIGNIVEGVFTKSDLTVEDIAGEWTANGSAVSFKSDNFLKKAGGIAAAGAVESQLNDYYKKYGLNNLVFTVNPDSTFSLGIKKITLKGTISVKEKGVFTLKFKAFGSFGLGSMDAYITKTTSGLDLMFDADKIKNILSFAASLSGNKLVSTADKLLKQYDGICMGFKMKQTGEPQISAKETATVKQANKNESSGGLGEMLKGIFGQFAQ